MTEGNFVDYVKINVASGKGGKGSTHLRREKYVAKGGPDGGDGGRGGHIILRGNSQFWTLYHLKFKRHFKAEKGNDGGKNRITGSNGKDIFIDVPLGTVVKNTTDQSTIFEITEEGEERIICEGGKGGRGNWHFKSSTNQTPRYAQPGLPNQEIQITLELKVLADVGLVGVLVGRLESQTNRFVAFLEVAAGIRRVAFHIVGPEQLRTQVHPSHSVRVIPDKQGAVAPREGGGEAVAATVGRVDVQALGLIVRIRVLATEITGEALTVQRYRTDAVDTGTTVAGL